jgi:hypothetical protein
MGKARKTVKPERKPYRFTNHKGTGQGDYGVFGLYPQTHEGKDNSRTIKASKQELRFAKGGSSNRYPERTPS